MDSIVRRYSDVERLKDLKDDDAAGRGKFLMGFVNGGMGEVFDVANGGVDDGDQGSGLGKRQSSSSSRTGSGASAGGRGKTALIQLVDEYGTTSTNQDVGYYGSVQSEWLAWGFYSRLCLWSGLRRLCREGDLDV